MTVGGPPACVFAPPVMYLPCPQPCPAFGHVGLLRGKAERTPPLATLHDPLSPPDTQTVLLRLQLDRGDSGLEKPGGDHQGSEGAQLPLATPFSCLPGLLGVPLMPLVAMMALCMDIAGPVGTKLFLLPLLPTEVPRCRGAREGLSLAEWMFGEMRDGPGFLVQCILEFI